MVRYNYSENLEMYGSLLKMRFLLFPLTVGQKSKPATKTTETLGRFQSGLRSLSGAATE